jgi:hypothetical protein
VPAVQVRAVLWQGVSDSGLDNGRTQDEMWHVRTLIFCTDSY